MTSRESYLEQSQHHKEIIFDYEQNIIPRLQRNLEDPKFSTARKQGFKRLLQISKQELQVAKQSLEELLAKGEIDAPFDDGTAVATWQRKAHPERKSLPFREWKKKYGDTYTKVKS